MKSLVLLCLGPLAAYAQTCAYPPCYYNHTTINPLPPYYMGTSGIIPVVLNSYTITGSVGAGTTTFTCATNCSKLQVGQGVTGSDGVNLIYPSVSGQLGTMITQISGTTITTSQASNVLTTPGTYTLTIGKDRWDLNSTAVVNSIGTNHIWAGLASNGNSTWAQGWLSGDCDTGAKVTNCFLMNTGSSSQVNNFWGARTSDNTASGAVEANVSLAVNDDTAHSKALWNHYWETILLSGAAGSNQTRALESTVYNYNATSGALKPDPWFVNKNGATENIRLSVGQSGVGTLYNSMDAISIVGIGGSVFETGILFDATSLDQSTTTNPPAIALPAGTNGYGITWYKATGYTTPSWNLYSNNTTKNGNTLVLEDTDALFRIPNDLSVGLVTIGSGSLKLSGNHTATFNGSGVGQGLDVESVTINDDTSSGAVASIAVNHIGLPTLTSTSATTIANAATMTITGCPVASTNVTITTCQAFRVFGDISRFDGRVDTFGGINVDGAMYISSTAPTIASGFNTSGGSVTGAATAAFSVTVGTSTGTSTGVLTMPTAVHGWACSPADVTTPATHMIQQTGSSTTSVTVTDYARTTGVAQNMANSDVIVFHCGAF